MKGIPVSRMPPGAQHIITRMDSPLLCSGYPFLYMYPKVPLSLFSNPHQWGGKYVKMAVMRRISRTPCLQWLVYVVLLIIVFKETCCKLLCCLSNQSQQWKLDNRYHLKLTMIEISKTNQMFSVNCLMFFPTIFIEKQRTIVGSIKDPVQIEDP